MSMASSESAHSGTGLKSRLKAYLQAKPKIWNVYWRVKQQLKRVFLLKYFLYDASGVYRSMFWAPSRHAVSALSSELLFQYHKLEKGLAMPGERRRFGVEPAMAVIALCRRWLEVGYLRSDPIFLGAIETLHGYVERLEQYGLDVDDVISSKVKSFLLEVVDRNPDLRTPVLQPKPGGRTASFASFSDLAVARRSVRNFKSEPVASELLQRATCDAQLSPSACNRQPCRLRIVSDSTLKRSLLAHQNGNRGFGHLAPHIVVLTADETCFFDASERHEPYIDGGLFAMSFVLALRDLGVASCCLNWCVSPKTDQTVHGLLKIPQKERIIMLIAVGYESEECWVPRSPRRSMSEVLTFM